MIDNRLALELMIKERQQFLIKQADERRLLKELEPAETTASQRTIDRWLRRLIHQVRMLI